jgi:O-Antigen ligase
MRFKPDPAASRRRPPLLASGPVTSVAPAPQGAAHEVDPAASGTTPSRTRPGIDAVLGLVLATALVVLAFTTTGGFDSIAQPGDTWSEIAVAVLGVGACCAVVVCGARARAWGGATIALFAALTVLTALSIAWSVQPDNSWQAASQMLAYLAAFTGAAALARLVPERWPAVVGGLATASVALSAYALLVKVFPASLDAGNTLGRLQAPYGYWNAVGVMAALGLAPCLWAAASPGRARALRALSIPGIALLIAVVVLSYSRSAALVAILAVAGWFAFVPLRLRAAAALGLGGTGAAVIAVWTLSTSALTDDGVALTARDSAGHTFGIVLLAIACLLGIAGWALSLAMDRIQLPMATRRRTGQVLVVLVALLPAAGIGALAVSARGFTGEISHVWSTLTNPAGVVGDNPGRLLQLSSSRPLYWSEGITVGEHAVLKGVGAEGFATARTAYTSSSFPVSHAHSYVIQTFADLGLIGLAVNLALLIAWAIAAARSLAPRTAWDSLRPQRTAEREGMITLLVVALAFGVQSAIDWTWFFSAVAIPALIAAGWLAGRGPLTAPVGRASVRRPLLQRPAAGAVIIALVALALLGAWSIWQPLRSANAVSSSLSAAASGNRPQAFTEARGAAKIDPVSIEPLQILSSLYSAARDLPAARAQLVQATQRQPANPQTWLWLGVFDRVHGDPRRAFGSLRRALRLDKTDSVTIGELNATRTDLGLPPPKP